MAQENFLNAMNVVSIFLNQKFIFRRPKKTLPGGVKVRMRVKRSQNNKCGRKKKKYISAQREYPKTPQNISDKDIHANHVEA